MTINTADRKTLIGYELEKSERTWNEAEFCANGNMWNLVGNRLYYSVFHAVIALLLMKEIGVQSHKGATRMFAMHYVKTGIFTEDDQMLYSRLQTIREKADYQNVYELNEEEARTYIELAQDLLGRIKTYIASEIRNL